MNDKEKKVKNVGYYIGTAFGVTISACLMSLLIAITVKVISMMF